VKAKSELTSVEPFKIVLSGDREAMAKLSTKDFMNDNREDAAHFPLCRSLSSRIN
jgi:hypothetical protein